MTSTQAITESRAGRGQATLALVTLVAFVLLLFLIFHQTVLSLVDIWSRSQTFAHGFLVMPISIWLVWRERSAYSSLTVRPQPYALLLVVLFGAIWLLAHMVDVRVLEQLAFVAILVSGIWAIIGNAMAARAAFPLLFLFLAVPMGAELIPPLMNLTATTTEYLVRASGVPLYREGMYLYLPTGTWSVIAECSGVRYLIASFTLGLIYAYLTYSSLQRRLLFVIASIVVPILANSLRAYGVVMMGHLSDMRLGVGVDHLVYGWGFFGLVMVILFWAGGFWQEDTTADIDSGVGVVAAGTPASGSLAFVAACAVILAAIWPAATWWTLEREAPLGQMAPLTLSQPEGVWQPIARLPEFWQPDVAGADRELDQFYSGPQPVALFLRQFLTQSQGSELVASAEPWRPEPRQLWRVVDQQRMTVDIGSLDAIEEVQIRHGGTKYLVWSWYHIAGRNVANPYVAKFLEAQQKLLQARRTGARVFVATQIPGDVPEDARAALEAITAAQLSSIADAVSQGLASQ
ncbi:exosortase A [Haliea salexigens]|uniref:exosortase A n=1 Tax=Haliea salexigens TaxID=287487 RepID=UPI0003F58759|nr:exosortase A [Haliea salexigens]|tara:strand:+ start:7320 stop:8873 length:1554 start_codon:yes stop_codon:yes gene_type:complete